MLRANKFPLALAVAGLAGCSALLDLRDDYQLATDAQAPFPDAQGDSSVLPDVQFSDVAADASGIGAPRQIAPITTATTSIQRPTFKWTLPTGVEGGHVEICKDRACSTITAQFDSPGAFGRPTSALSPGLYFWRVHGRVGQTTGVAVSSTWEVWVRKDSGVVGEIDSSFGAFPDFNGDGLGDIATSGGGSGGADVFLSTAKFGPSDSSQFSITDPARMMTDSFAAMTYGDVDGDGLQDLVLGTFNQSGPSDANNHVVIYRGATGFDKNAKYAWTINVPAGANDAGLSIDDFAATVQVPGDVNGDGYDDLLVGSILNGHKGGNVGPTFLYFGHANGPSTTPDAMLVDDNGYHFHPVGRVGDVDGDGYADAVLTAEGIQGTWVYRGGAKGLSDTNRYQLAIPPDVNSWDRFATGAGDVDGDGYPEIMAGSPYGFDDAGAQAGKVYLYRGQNGPGLLSPHWTLHADGASIQFGASNAIIGDVNGDGFDDVVVGAAFAPAGQPSGRAYFYPGAVDGVKDSSVTKITGNGGYFGGTAATGDVDGDGMLDALIAGNQGYIDVYFGKAGASITDSSTKVTVHPASVSFMYIIADLWNGALAWRHS